MEVEQKTVTEEPEFKIELAEDVAEALKRQILDSNPDKKEEDLKDQIASALADEVKKLEEENKDAIAAFKELSKKDEWKDKTQDEIFAEAVRQANSAEYAKPAPVEFDLFETKTEEQKPAGSEGKGATELPDDVKEKLAELESLRADPLFDIYAKARKSGGVNFLDVLKKENLLLDVKSLSNEDIYKAELMRLKELDPSVTDESIEDAMDDFKRKSAVDRSMVVAPLRAKLEEVQAERAKALSSTFKGTEQRVDPEKLMQDFNIAAQSLKGKKFMYTEISDAEVARASEQVRNGLLAFKKKDGSIDHDAAVKASIVLTNFRKLMDDARAEAFAEGRRAEQKKHGNAKSPIRISASTPQHKTDPNYEFEVIKRKAKEAGMSYSAYIQSQVA